MTTELRLVGRMRETRDTENCLLTSEQASSQNSRETEHRAARLPGLVTTTIKLWTNIWQLFNKPVNFK